MVDRSRGNERTAATAATGGGQSQPSTPGGMAHQQAAQVKEQVQQTAADLKSQVTDQATGKLEEQKTAASGSLNTLAHAVRQTADQLEENDQETIARYIHRAAAQVESVADYIGRRDLQGLARDTEQFARREPALFLGGAFTLGLFAARFLKSSGTSGGATSGQAMSGTGGTMPALPATSSYRAPSTTTPPPPITTPPASPSTRPSGLSGTTSGSSGVSGGLSGTASGLSGMSSGIGTPATGPGNLSDTSDVGGATATGDAIVGGPPISPDIIVGGPPHEPGKEPRR